MAKWKTSEWVIFSLACLMLISLFLPWLKRTIAFDPIAIELAESFAQETQNPITLRDIILPRSGQLEVAVDQLLRGWNAFYIFTDIRRSPDRTTVCHFFVGHLLGKGNLMEKAYVFLLLPVITMGAAFVAISHPKSLRLAAYSSAALLILYLVIRIRLVFTDAQREFVGVALGLGLWLWLYSTLLLCIWLLLRATFPKSKFF